MSFLWELPLLPMKRGGLRGQIDVHFGRDITSILSISLISLSPMTSIEGEMGAQEGGEGSIGDEGKK
jgi:hypothetical protein